MKPPRWIAKPLTLGADGAGDPILRKAQRMNRFYLLAGTYGMSYCLWQIIANATRLNIHHSSCVIFAISASIVMMEFANLIVHHNKAQSP